MSDLTLTLNTHEIHKGLNFVGLSLSETELNELKIGNAISLECRSLSEIGSLFILAAALSAVNLGKLTKNVTFRDLDLLKAVTQSTGCPGIPIYCWNDDSLNRCCLYLTLVEGKPTILINKDYITV